MAVGTASPTSPEYITPSEMTTDFIQECIGNIMYKSCLSERDDPAIRLRN